MWDVPDGAILGLGMLLVVALVLGVVVMLSLRRGRDGSGWTADEDGPVPGDTPDVW